MPEYETSSAPVRKVDLADCRSTIEPLAGGAMLVRNVHRLDPYERCITLRLDRWAREAPERTWLAEREGDRWYHLSYREGRERVRRIAAALLGRGLSAERPVAILSGNGIDHALLGTAALYAGIPYAPVAPAYSLVSSDHSKLRYILELLTPGLVFVSDAAPYARALAHALPAGVELVVRRNPPADRAATDFASLEALPPGPALDTAHAAVGPDTIAKFLFTSGSTGTPKAVINTQRMLCANAVQISTHFAYFRDKPPVTLDWSPWNHTAGGNHNFNLVLHNGGTLYIDDGKPLPGAIEATVRNLLEVSPNWYFNVPKGFDALIPYLRADRALCRSLFRDLEVFWYAGAGMARHTWDALDEIAVRTTGERVTVLTGLGATETAPFAIAANQTMVDAGLVGLPARGCDVKLVPAGGKLEVRVRGPNVTPGYWRQPALTAAAFDEEGFYRLGDAVRFADPHDVNRGFYFDGRVAEDFKLATGTWVAVGPLRAAFIDHCAPLVQDVVIAGIDRDEVAALVVLEANACRAVAGRAQAGFADLARDPAVRAALRERIGSFAAKATGSSNRIARAILLEEPPSIDRGELTDKGSINQRAVLANRADLVERLYASGDALVLRSG